MDPMKKIVVFTLIFFISLIALKTAFAQGIVVTSEDVYDTGRFDGWSRGNSNGLIEPGERIELRVTVKNNGRNTANDVHGFLHTTNTSVKIYNSKVDYGDIPAGSHSPTYLMLFQGYQDLQRYAFNIEVLDGAIADDVSFNLTLAASNRAPSSFEITLPIVDHSKIRLQFPDDLISEDAFSSGSTYFIFKAKHPTLTGVSDDTEVIYGNCIITLHIPEGVQPFMFPIQTKSDIAKENGIDLLLHITMDIVSQIAEEGIKDVTNTSTIIELFAKTAELFGLLERDLKVTIPNIVAPGRGRPDTEIEYLVLLKHPRSSLGGIKVTVEQKYRLGDSSENFTAVGQNNWNFDNGWAFLSQLAEPIVGSNYPNPFNLETWIPYRLSEPTDVTLTIHTVNGQVVRQLVLGHQPEGVYHSINRAAYWDGRNAQGEYVASGLYFYTLKAGEFTATRKMLIRK